MKKQLAVIMALFTLFISAGCASVPDKGNDAAQTKQEQQETAPAAKETTIGSVAGLGDTESAWNTQFGPSFAKGDTLKLYAGGAYEVVFEQQRAVTITFPSKDGKNPLDETLLPKDGKKQSESSRKTGGMTMTVEKWHSPALEKALPDTKGIYTIMKNQNGSTYDTVIVDCTPNLKK